VSYPMAWVNAIAAYWSSLLKKQKKILKIIDNLRNSAVLIDNSTKFNSPIQDQW